MRLDQLLVMRGLARTRSQAREAILRGAVLVEGAPARRPGQNVAESAALTAEDDPYVGRGAHKLVHALDTFGLDPAGAIALDTGASTGGFTEVLLRRGAAHVTALDVGHGQLAPCLAEDPRVTVMDGVNARLLSSEDLARKPDFLTFDVSFISLTLVLPAVLGTAAPGARMVALVKPQFEVGRAEIGKGGIVRNADVAFASVERVEAVVTAAGFSVLGRTASPIEGGDGNREWLIAAQAT
ncbi:TlyA family RNA methyltransferase [Acuticoccus sp. MNP-M23]|uniref:TlyA family RNA methyltransferase n=1 Tax=Acuticoccus sp. MNP-M23 TaxID=3072793 RepID=UPI0028165E42|nr:TlyA family RNA methyltransferase [Acuticoccus sp. MNP-M23]WMS43323.1 TlyA family RNA methyltransferase [Acuticoccus sp. MNP-M23]